MRMIGRGYAKLCFSLSPLLASCQFRQSSESFTRFDGQWAYELVSFQVALGPRIPGTEADRGMDP